MYLKINFRMVLEEKSSEDKSNSLYSWFEPRSNIII